MSKITIKFRDGTERSWSERRGGGSYYNKSVTSEGWVIVTDVWGNNEAFPSDLVLSVIGEERS